MPERQTNSYSSRTPSMVLTSSVGRIFNRRSARRSLPLRRLCRPLALGQVALGGAGIDIAALLARRRDLIVPDFALPRVGTVDLSFDQAVAATRSWSPLDQRRFFVRLGALGSVLTDDEVLSLLQQGFDVDEDARPGPRLIVSPNDITRLLALGYQITVMGQAEQ